MDYDETTELVGFYFKPYSVLDLSTIITHMRESELNHLLPDSVLTSEVYGYTCFETMIKSKSLMDTLRVIRNRRFEDNRIFFRQLTSSLIRPSAGEFGLLTETEQKIKKVTNPSKKPQYKRNIL
jgi:hypothetical protein